MNRKTALLASAVVVGLLGVATGVRAEPEIGLVTQKEYTGARGTRVGAEAENLYFRNDVYENETVQTGSGGGTKIEFADSTRLQVGTSSKVVLDKFLYDPSKRSGEATITFGKGIFRFVTGEMHKEGFNLRTPTATLIVRGTIFALWVLDSGAISLSVEQGRVELRGCGGHTVTVTAFHSIHQPEDCSEPLVTLGRNVPKDPGIDGDGGGGGDRGDFNRSREKIGGPGEPGDGGDGEGGG